jgi:hypothetical protein
VAKAVVVDTITLLEQQVKLDKDLLVVMLEAQMLVQAVEVQPLLVVLLE